MSFLLTALATIMLPTIGGMLVPNGGKAQHVRMLLAFLCAAGGTGEV
jgi:hypothetical protein